MKLSRKYKIVKKTKKFVTKEKMMELTVENLQRLVLEPNEILVITMVNATEPEREEVRERIRATLQKNGYGNDVIIINEEIEMFAISKEE